MGEFDLIAHYFKRPARRAALGVGDDCALLRLAPGMQTIGLSATVADPMDLQRWLVPQVPDENRHAGVITVSGGAKPAVL